VAVRFVSAGGIATSAREIESALFKARAEGGLVICAPVYCELLAYPSATRHFIQQFCRETGIFLDFLLDEQVWERTAKPLWVMSNVVVNREAALPSGCWWTSS
jgi:hypothetical protein